MTKGGEEKKNEVGEESWGKYWLNEYEKDHNE